MADHGRRRPSNTSDASSSSSMSVRDHHHNSSATYSSSPDALELADTSLDPSFAQQRVVTSTPRKARRQSRSDDEGPERDDLRLSDTESLMLLDDEAIDTGIERFEERQRHARLTRRSLATHLEERDLLQPYYSSNSLTPRRESVLHAKTLGRDLYAPSPSTGSSTLVDKEEEGFAKSRERDTTVRRGAKGPMRTPFDGDVVLEYGDEEHDDDERTEVRSPSKSRAATRLDDDAGSSSSPRPTRRSTVGDLANYVDARLSSSAPSPSSTPRRSAKPRRQVSSTLPPQTPHAPGAFPSSNRKSRPLTPPAETATPVRSVAASRQKTPSSNGGGSSAQIREAFTRFITGPQGALTNSAERRLAAMQSASTLGPASTSKREREKVETPDFAGRYSFIPSSTLPVEKMRKNPDGVNRDDEDGMVGPTNLERALRRVGGSTGSVESEFVSRRRLEYQRQRQVSVSEGEDHVEDEEIPPSEEDEVRVAQRSAIDFAMTRSFAERDDKEGGELGEDSPPPPARDDQFRPERSNDLRSSVRFAETASPPRSRTPSPPSLPLPSRRSISSPSRPSVPPRPSSPELPPLPPLLAPDSPEPVRNMPSSSSFRRSYSTAQRPSSLRDAVVPNSPSTPPRQLAFEPHSPRSPSPPNSPIPIEPPKSSTPPRRVVRPPSPDATPPRASPSPLARRVKLSPKRQTPSPPLSPSPALQAAFDDRPRERSLSGPEEDKEDMSIPLLVGQLSAAVRALTEAHASPKSPPRQRSRDSSDDSRLPSRDRSSHELTRRKAESDRNRRALENELIELESQDQAEVDRRNDVALELAETYELEHELGFKVEELRKSIHDMGQLVGDQVAQAVNDSLKSETRRRAHWLGLAFCLQLGLFWILLRLANAQASFGLDAGSYFDPFQPPVLHHRLNPYASDVLLDSSTVALFAPYVSSPGSAWSGLERTASILKGSLERIVDVVVTRWTEAPKLANRGRSLLIETVPVPI